MAYKRRSPQPVVEGGTGDQSLTSYAVLCGGITTTSPIQSVVGTGTLGQVLTSNGAALLPTWQPGGGGGSGITTLDGNTGSATGATVTISGTEGSTVFTGSGAALTLSYTYLTQNTYVGNSAGNVGTSTGSYNSGFGWHALDTLTGGNFNCALGRFALGGGITGGAGDFNTGVGYFAGQGNSGSHNSTIGAVAFGSNNTTGSDNCCIGYNTGSLYNSAESSNILIGSSVTGTTGESNVLRIGSATGTGTAQINTAYIAGINGNTVSNTQMVTINSSTNQLGTATIPAGPFTTQFFAYNPTASIANATGDGTFVTSSVMTSTLFNNGSAYNTGTGVFTAPATGLYYFTVSFAFDNITSAHTLFQMILVTTGHTYGLQIGNPFAAGGNNSGDIQYFANTSVLVPMTSGDTASARANIANGAKTVNLDGTGAGAFATYFSGFRVA
jgi:hypothetical protein